NDDPGEARAADIMEACMGGGDPSATEAVAVFVRTLGNVVGDLTMIHLPFGGVYLIGGVARAMVPHFESFGFADAFHDKGRFAGFMQNFAVSVIDDDFAALTGLIAYLEN
ncbi:MAG: glucokinase, partial [Pseudomonadota bacterium]